MKIPKIKIDKNVVMDEVRKIPKETPGDLIEGAAYVAAPTLISYLIKKDIRRGFAKVDPNQNHTSNNDTPAVPMADKGMAKTAEKVIDATNAAVAAIRGSRKGVLKVLVPSAILAATGRDIYSALQKQKAKDKKDAMNVQQNTSYSPFYY